MFTPALTTAFMTLQEDRNDHVGDPDFPRGCLWSGGDDEVGAVEGELAANPHMGWVHSVPEDRIKLLGVAEGLGAIGLVVPMAIGIAPILTRIAAVCLATLMGGAAATHTMRGESAAVSTILAVLVIAVAAFR